MCSARAILSCCTLCSLAALQGACSAHNGATTRALGNVAVRATVETQPVASLDDAADDPAIWVNPGDPSQSLILGTDKRAGLAVYDLSGSQVQFLPVGRVNNVDVSEGLRLAGVPLTIAAASQRDDRTVILWQIDRSGRLAEVPGSPLRTNLSEPYGLGMSWAAGDGVWIFVNDKDGRVEQWLVRDDGTGLAKGTLVRTLVLGSQPEGVAVDARAGVVFLGEEGRGVWRYPLDPLDQTRGVLIAQVKPHGELTPDVEGLALTEDYLLVSSQGSNQYALYERAAPHRFVALFRIGAGPTIDGAQETDGLDVTTHALGPAFPMGVLVVQDGDNDGLPQNFKLVPWDAVLRELGLPLGRKGR